MPQLLLACLLAADYDLTGQILWPGGRLLAEYLGAHPELLRRSGACELGSGLGLVGIFASQALPVVLTDHNPVILEVLARNVELNQGHYPCRWEAAA